MPDLSKYSQSLQLPDLGSGGLFALLVLVVILLFALSLGRTRVLISLLAVYVAFTLQAVFPYFAYLQEMLSKDLPTLRVGVFLLLYLITFGLLNRSVLLARFNLSEAAFFSVVFMGIIQLGLLVSIILNLAPSFYSINDKIPKELLPYIATQRALFYWTLLPLFMLLFAKRSPHEN